jgi:sodium/potassium-transporting ATPase subunit beta
MLLILFLDYSKTSNNQKNCDFDAKPREGQVCKLDFKKFSMCTKENKYGYANASPCIFLKLNRIYGWEPEYYNDTESLPDTMPKSLVDEIKSLNQSERNQVWVSCRGEDGSDKEAITDIKYFPSQGFPSYFYPYMNSKNYLSPLVAVKFMRVKRKFKLFFIF